jgi:hypothetical protein
LTVADAMRIEAAAVEFIDEKGGGPGFAQRSGN